MNNYVLLCWQQQNSNNIIVNEMVWKKRFRKRRPTVRSLAKKVHALQGASEVKEHHQYTYSRGGAALSTTFNATTPVVSACLCTPQRGSGIQNRDSDQIRLTSLHLSGVIYVPGGGAFLGQNNKVRIIVFYDMNPNGALPILCGTAPGSGSKQPLFLTTSSSTIFPFTQYNTLDACYTQYKVIYDKTYSLQTKVGTYNTATGLYSSVNPEINFNIKKKLKRKTSLERGNAGNIGDVQTNALFVAFICDYAGSPTLEIDLDSTVYFKDD